MDINSAVGREQGITDAQLADLATFVKSAHFSALEKTILRYAEGMTQNPAEVAEPVFTELKQYFNTAQIVELTTMIAFENLRARFNRALHIEADGFCELPADHPVRKAYRPGNRDERLLATAKSRRPLEDEFADLFDRLLAFRQTRRRQMPHVRHLVPDLQGGIDTRLLRFIGEAGRIVEQRFGIADLDEQRGKVVEIGVERRR